MFCTRRSRLLIIVSLWFSSVALAHGTVAQTPDEIALRAIVEHLFVAYAKEDLQGFMSRWSAKSPELDSRRKMLQEFFAGHEQIEISSVQVRKLTVEGEKATARVEVDVSGVETKTGQRATGLGKMNRAIGFVKERGEWKVWRDVAAEEDLAAALVAAKTDAERNSLLATEKDLVTPVLFRALNRQGRRLAMLGDNPEALNTYNLALQVAEQIHDDAGIAAIRNNIGLVYLSIDDYDSALTHLKESLRLHKAQDNKRLIAQTMNSIGTAYRHQGDYRSALEHFETSLRLHEELGDKAGIALGYNHLGGLSLAQGNYALALDFQHKALKLSEESGNKIGIADSLHEIGSIHLSQGNFSEALTYLQKNLELLEALKHRAGLSYLTGNIGLVHYRQGNYTAALEYFHKTLELSESVGHKRGIALTLYNLARVHFALGDYTQSLKYSERAASLSREMPDPDALWRARSMSGKAHRALNQPGPAQLAFDEAIGIIEGLRSRVAGGEETQQRFLEDRVSSYHSMVDLLASQNKPVEALAYAERAKGRVLLDVLRSGRVNITKAMTQQEQNKERKLSINLSLLNSQVSRESQRPQPDPTRLEDLKTRQQKARLEHEAFQLVLYAAHPELKTQRGEVKTLTLEEADRLLPDARSALLEYVVTEDHAYLFALTKTDHVNPGAVNLKMYTLAIKGRELADQIEGIRQQLAKRDLRFRESAKRLYDLLLKAARTQLHGKSRLVIVPDGVLWELPFQALVSAEDRYLLEDHSISYAPSLTVLREMIRLHQNGTSKGKDPQSLLAFGNPALGEQTGRAKLALRYEKLDPLPEAEREAKVLGQLYGAVRSKVYVGTEAREEVLKKEAGKFPVVHLATHGILNDVSPMYSHLLLAQTAGSPNDDGLLEAWEIMKLDLNADLVVLSACETGRGKVGAGEGMIGLAWALFVAGTPTSVVSQWKVDSKSTTELMIDFHRNLRAGMQTPGVKMRKAKALREAALKLLRTNEYRHPFYWAGFVLIGDAD
jgi:CHAT domain-containing protein/Tfp pilus assembly protein PilF